MPKTPGQNPVKVVPRFSDNDFIIYFVDKLDFSDDWYVLGENTSKNCSYLTIFEGPDAKERAEEYCNWKNTILIQIKDTFLVDSANPK